ncbi:hypothetical protein ACVWVY_001600 [Bradyrhizobium sp. URHC0002]
MPPTWYVTFESRPRGLLAKKRRSPRETRTFATEGEAKILARSKLDEGLIVFAGTINPHLPRRHIPSGQISMWLTEGSEDSAEVPPPLDKD